MKWFSFGLWPGVRLSLAMGVEANRTWRERTEGWTEDPLPVAATCRGEDGFWFFGDPKDLARLIGPEE